MVIRSDTYPVVCVCGPTAVGKSSFAIELAQKLGAQIINADSVQVYRGFDIGSGKVTEDEMQGVPHHLLSHVGPEEHYSAGRFRKEAFSAIKKISNSKTLPIIAGGTGLYIRALLSPFMGDMEDIYSSGFESARIFIEKLKQTLTTEEFLQKISAHLRWLDPEACARNGVKDLFRNERALCLSLACGVPSSLYRHVFNDSEYQISAFVIILEEDRNILYEKINRRVEKMFSLGWQHEVKTLMDHNPASSALQAIGYRHIFNELKVNHLESLNKLSLINNIQRDTRRFAKRQITWWRNQPAALGWSELEISNSDAMDFDLHTSVRNELSTQLGSTTFLEAKQENNKVMRGAKVNLIQMLVKHISDFREKSMSQIESSKNYGDDAKNNVVYVRVRIT